MILYHGSYTQIGIPKIIVQEKGRDFGFGFYTTSIKNQAERWAIRTARLRSRHSDTTENAVVNLYEFDEDPIATLLEDDSMGLYGQSALYVYSLITNECEP